MIEIQLTQGQTAIVDDCDADLAELKWYAIWDRHSKSYYARRIQGGKCYLMHRVILGRMLNKELGNTELVDHIHGFTLDNRRSEIRLANKNQNQHNRGKSSHNTSGYKGVCWVKADKRWKAQIMVNSKQEHLGYFNTAEEAHIAYCNRADEVHGEFVNHG